MFSWCGLSHTIVCCCWKREILFFHLPPSFWPRIPASHALSLKLVAGTQGPRVKSLAAGHKMATFSRVPFLPFCTVPELPPAATQVSAGNKHIRTCHQLTGSVTWKVSIEALEEGGGSG